MKIGSHKNIRIIKTRNLSYRNSPMISFKDLSNLRLEKRYVDADMPVASWFSRQADGNKESSPLAPCHGRSGVDGGLWGSRSHLCNRFMVKCYTNAYKGFSLSLFPTPSFISLSSSFFTPLYLLSFLFFSSLALVFLAVSSSCSCGYRGMHRHFRASPRYRCCKSTRRSWDLRYRSRLIVR